MRYSDEELVLKCLEGDTEAFAQLVHRYQQAVYAVAWHYAGRYGGAEDIVQEAFWAAYRSLPQLRDPAQFAPWLKGITTRTAANWLRKNAPRLRNETPLPHRRARILYDAEGRNHRPEDDADFFEAICKAIEALPDRYQVPVVLRYVQQLSYEEISKFTGESYNEIRGILSRATKMLREAIATEMEKFQERYEVG